MSIKMMMVAFAALIPTLNINASEIYTVYLVRHADKVTTDAANKDPMLTRCGMQRAKNLANILKHVEIDDIYSTDYKRTQATAAPVAQDKTLNVISYDPRKLDEITKEITKNKHNTLVVGHNSTTNVIAGNLAGLTLPMINEKEYDRLYQVTVTPKGAKLQLLNQSFKCD